MKRGWVGKAVLWLKDIIILRVLRYSTGEIEINPMKRRLISSFNEKAGLLLHVTSCEALGSLQLNNRLHCEAWPYQLP